MVDRLLDMTLEEQINNKNNNYNHYNGKNRKYSRTRPRRDWVDNNGNDTYWDGSRRPNQRRRYNHNHNNYYDNNQDQEVVPVIDKIISIITIPIAITTTIEAIPIDEVEIEIMSIKIMTIKIMILLIWI